MCREIEVTPDPWSTVTSVIDRRDLGSWISGPGRAPGAAEPGTGLGLPAEGVGSVARAGRRIGAIILDWLSCVLVAYAFFDGDSWATLAIFGLVQVLSIGTMGSSPGHRVFRLRVTTVSGGWPGPARALVRTVLLCLFIPAVIYDRDHRGLHDRAAGTVLVRA